MKIKKAPRQASISPPPDEAEAKESDPTLKALNKELRKAQKAFE